MCTSDYDSDFNKIRLKPAPPFFKDSLNVATNTFSITSYFGIF